MASNRLAVEEAGLTEIGIEALHALVSQAENGQRFAGGTSHVVVIGVFRMYDPMKNGQPNQRLRLSLHPTEKVAKLDLVLVRAFQTRSNRKIDDRSTERGRLAQIAGNRQ